MSTNTEVEHNRQRLDRLAEANVAQQEQTAAVLKARAFTWNTAGLILSTGWIGGTVWLIAQAWQAVAG